MGNIFRMATYDRSANIANAIPALELLGPSPLKWHRLDDGVMGGRSETLHQASSSSSSLHFTGNINTSGGGFTSIRAPLPPDVKFPANAEALKVTFRGDGKTYKFLLSDGKGAGGPSSRSPSWQHDIPTKKYKDGDEPDVQVLSLEDFLPSFGPRPANAGDYELDITDMREIGLMLSLKLSNGKPNPPETFGVGQFGFSLWVDKIEVVSKKDEKEEADTCDQQDESGKNEE